jgi:hypothetical protein
LVKDEIIEEIAEELEDCLTERTMWALRKLTVLELLKMRDEL